MGTRGRITRGSSNGPHPLRRAVVGLLLGAALGAVAALLRPRTRGGEGG